MPGDLRALKSVSLLAPVFMEDQKYFKPNRDQFIAGVDEVGRGPLAGPVVAACALFHTVPNTDSALSALELEKLFIRLAELGVTDSKKLSASKREKILKALGLSSEQLKVGQNLIELDQFHSSLSVTIAEIHAPEIDRVNILRASLKAMALSFDEALKGGHHQKSEGVVLIDGNRPFDLLSNNVQQRTECLIKGDSRSFMIALGAIAAKQYRDLWMQKAGMKYPGYGLEKHAGYPTAVHREALEKLGPSQIHRKSFKGVREYVTSL